MELRDYTIQRTRVPLPGKAAPGGEKPFFEVRGLCADDLTFLLSMHHGQITKALLLYQEQRERIMGGGKGLTDFILTLAREFPDLVAEVISAATDSLDDTTRKVAKQLPFTTQLVALNEIVKLTMEEVSGLKNLLAEMRERIASANRAK
jgi:hypothetical protein